MIAVVLFLFLFIHASVAADSASTGGGDGDCPACPIPTGYFHYEVQRALAVAENAKTLVQAYASAFAIMVDHLRDLGVDNVLDVDADDVVGFTAKQREEYGWLVHFRDKLQPCATYAIQISNEASRVQLGFQYDGCNAEQACRFRDLVALTDSIKDHC